MEALILAAVALKDILPLISTMAGGGIIGYVIQWRKSGAERDNIATTATKQAIEVFESTIDRLQEDLSANAAELQAMTEKVTSLRQQMGDLNDELDRYRRNAKNLIAENEALRLSQRNLLGEVDRLHKQLGISP